MASSRLKRKVEVGDQGEFGNLTENFVSVGTPLPALTENKKDKNEFKPVWEQEVYDDQGRRRLHGAFTGGFSAGYYNTVGSKEGWAPSTFKSSRSERASNVKSSVADAAKQFMDEEDLAELAASRTLETNQAYNSTSRPVASTPIADYDPLLGHFGSSAPAPPSEKATSVATPDDILSSLVQPSSARIGLKLMRQMGWRDGQGVGPRISYSRRKEQAAEIGIKLSDDDQDDSGEAEKHLYAPLDRPLHLVQGNSASTAKGWGLGYRPGLTLNARLNGEEGTVKGARASSGGYRVDEDPYSESDGGRTMGGRGVYGDMNDMDEDEEDYRIVTSGKKIPLSKAPTRPSTTQVFHDGTPVLPEFRLITEGSNIASTSRLPPPPPIGWQPNPSRLWKDPKIESNHDAKGKGKGKQLDADERGALLGEELPQPIPKSVFDYLSAKSRERLASLTNTSTLSSTETTTSTLPPALPPVEVDAQLFVPSLDRPTALAALKGFQPYSAASTSPDPVKQARYTLYLQYQASDGSSTTTSPFGPRKLPNGKLQTVQELNRELSEYSQSARVFKPVSGMLGNRFESSKTGSLDTPKVEPGLYQPPSKAQGSTSLPSSSDYLASTLDATSTPVPEPPAPKLSPAQVAAREGNFGHLTRTTSQFRPTKLLCKRFGVRDPYENGGDGGMTADEPGGAFGEATKTGWSTGESHKTHQPIGESVMDQMMESAGFKRFQAASKVIGEDEPEIAKGAFETPEEGKRTNSKGGTKTRQTIETVGMGDDEAQGEEIVEEERAPPDIFAAIFADSEDEDVDGEVESEEKEMQEEEDTSRQLEPIDSDQPSSKTTNPTLPVADLADITTVSDDPSQVSTISSQPLSLDSIASYKPSFVSTNSRATTSSSDTVLNPVKKKKKSKRKVALSFDLEGDEGDGSVERQGSSKKKKLKREEGSLGTQARGPKPSPPQEVDIEDEWEEVSKVHPSLAENSSIPAPSKVITKGRMKAADLY